MTAGKIILLALLLILIIILLIPVGVEAAYSADGFIVNAALSFFRIKILPAAELTEEEKAKKEKKREEKERKKREKEAKKPKKEKPSPTLAQIISLARDSIPHVLNVLSRFDRKLTIAYLKFKYISASRDPYDAVMNYGYATTALSAMLPVLENHFKVERREIHLSADTEGEGKDTIEAGIKLTLKIWEIFYIAFALFPMIKLAIRFLREQKANAKHTEQQEEALPSGK